MFTPKNIEIWTQILIYIKLSSQTWLYLLIFQDPAATPTKATKKEKKQLKKKSDKDDDRASPEANAQEQMAAQRASGGVIDAPPEIRVGQISLCLVVNTS